MPEAARLATRRKRVRVPERWGGEAADETWAEVECDEGECEEDDSFDEEGMDEDWDNEDEEDAEDEDYDEEDDEEEEDGEGDIAHEDPDTDSTEVHGNGPRAAETVTRPLRDNPTSVLGRGEIRSESDAVLDSQSGGQTSSSDEERAPRNSYSEPLIIGEPPRTEPVLYRPDGRPATQKESLNYHADEKARIGRINADIARVAGTDYELDVRETSVIVGQFDGNAVLITTGYSLMLTRDELAAALAHEHAHGICQHIDAANSRWEQFCGALSEIWSNKKRGILRKVMSTVGHFILRAVSESAVSRRDELDADRMAVELCAKAGYDGKALASALRKGHAPEELSYIEELLATHPPLKVRRSVILEQATK